MAKGSKEIRKRIRSVKNTQQVTKAMKMVAASRLRKSEGRTQASRPYSDTLREVMGSLAGVAGDVEHPYLKHIAPEVNKVLVLHVASDKGLCGSYNTNINKNLVKFVKEQEALGKQVQVAFVGKKGLKFAEAEMDVEIAGSFPGFTEKTGFSDLKDIFALLSGSYEGKQVSEVYLSYARFVNIVKNIPSVIRLLPLEALEVSGEDEASEFRKEYDLEPNPEELLEILLPRYFQTQLFQAALESFTSENGARMVAMENATSAAGDMIDSLTLEYNKARQAGITLELLDIVGGAEALKG